MSCLDKVLKGGRRELILSGKEIAKQIEENGLDPCLFDALQLNYLSITDTRLKVLSPAIGELYNLVNLVLHSNCLKELPSEIGQLKNLKHLDVSSNCIVQLPTEISNLTEMVTLNVSSNQLTEIPCLKSNRNLHVLDLSYNKLEVFPDILYADLNFLAELKLDANEIKHIPASIRLLTSLKIFSIRNNQLCSLPLEVGNLKLKDLKLAENPFTDKNLKKTISTGNTKKIMEYIKKHCICTALSESSGSMAESDNNACANQESDKPENQVRNPVFTKHIQVELKPVASVFRMVNTIGGRKFILCCVVKNVDFTAYSFRSFLRLQTTLHTTCCEDRELASIGTHDFDLLRNKFIIYTCRDPSEIIFRPLGSDIKISAAEYFAEQKLKADKLSKRKKNSSGILKYMYLLDGAQTFPCLMTQDEKQVISLPPITNCEDSKMTLNTKNIFIEITSQHSYAVCKKVMETLLIELCQLGICDSSLNYGDIDEEQYCLGEEQYYLRVACVNIYNGDGSYYDKYPSPEDLTNYENNVKVTYIS